MSQSDLIDVGDAIETQPGGWYSTLILIACAAAMVVEGYDVQVVAYAAPAIIRDWHIDKAYFGPVFGAALFGYFLGATLLQRHQRQVRPQARHRHRQHLLRAAHDRIGVRDHDSRPAGLALRRGPGTRLLDPSGHRARRGVFARAPARVPGKLAVRRLHAGCGTRRGPDGRAHRPLRVAERVLLRRRRLAGARRPGVLRNAGIGALPRSPGKPGSRDRRDHAQE